MRSHLLAFCMCLLAGNVLAQPAGFKAVSNAAAFQQNLSKSTASLNTLQSDFVQTKHMSMLAEKIRSNGRFYYRKEDKVRIEYTAPFQYLLIMNGGQILVKDEQKSTRINARTSRMLQSVNRIMVDCMRGSVFSNPDFRVSAYESGTAYLLTLTPLTEAMKKMFRTIDVYMSKSQLDVERLTMTETGGDATEMVFTKSQRNIALNEALFKVR